MIILKREVFAEFRDVVRTVERTAGVVAAAPFVFVETRIASAGHAPVGVALKGIDPARAGSMYALRSVLKSGKLVDLEQGDPPGLILGDQLAASLGVHTGDRVVVTLPPLTPSGD